MTDFPPGFTSKRIKAGDVHLRAVIGGSGPPLLLIPGWPQTWYAWRKAAARLSKMRTVIIAEPRGMGESDKPTGSYDMGTLAGDMVALMDALGHKGPFDVAGHDLGTWIGYAMAADYPARLSRLVLIDAAVPGVSPNPSALAPPAINKRVWHFGFNRLGPELNEALVGGREDVFIGWQFRNKAARPDSLSDADIAVYVDAFRDPDTLRAGFDYYRAIETNVAQNARRLKTRLALPILIIAGEKGVGQAMVDGLSDIGARIESRILPEIGHYVPDEAPEALAELIINFMSAEPAAARR